jgi:hypothetical protein
MTAATLTNDIVTFCAAASGGGRAGRVLVSPNNGPQFAKITVRLSNIEGDEFIQACAAQLRLLVATKSKQHTYCPLEEASSYYTR